MTFLSIGSVRSQALTIDEIVDIPSGLSYWQKQDTRLNIEHPPLLKMISAVPLLFAGVKADYNDPSWCGRGGEGCEWLFGRKFFESWNANPQRVVFLARMPMLALTLVLGFVIYLMARTLTSPAGGAVSLILFATSPFYLGLGPLVLTDIGLPLFVLASVWTFASLWSNPNKRNMVLFAACFGSALLSKFSALTLFPVFFILWLYFRGTERLEQADASRSAAGGVQKSGPSEKSFWAELYAVMGIALASIFVYCFYVLSCWHSDSSYIFSQRASAFGTFNSAGRIVTRISWFLPKHPHLAKWLNPLWLYLSGVLDVYFRIDRPTYVLGKWHAHGVWFYFPTVSFFKLAPGMLGCFALLISLLVCYAWMRRTTSIPLVYEGHRHHLEALVIALIVFAGSAMSANLNIGIRHFSIPITIAVVLCALVVPLIKSLASGSIARFLVPTVAGVLATSCALTALLAYPHYISYYNFFRFGMAKQDIVANSNLYWGQSLIDLERFRDEHGISQIYVDSRTDRLDPAIYIRGATRWECDAPDPIAPEWAAVAANFLLREAPSCAGLLRYQHWYVSDQSIVVFHIADSSYAKDQQAYLRGHPYLQWTVEGFSDPRPSAERFLARNFSESATNRPIRTGVKGQQDVPVLGTAKLSSSSRPNAR